MDDELIVESEQQQVMTPRTIDEDRRALEALVVENDDLERLEALLDRFNIFEAVGAVRQELRHSDFLAFLFDPHQPHGLGDAFLKGFLHKALQASDRELPVSLIDLDVWSLDDTEVRREWHNIDVLILNEENRLAILIENKVDASESPGQMRRYHGIVEEHFADWRIVPVFLTPAGEMPSDERYVPISYAVVARLIETLLQRRVSTLGQDVASLMSHYAEMLRRHIVSESEIDVLCRRIYKKHQRALDLVFERRPDTQAEMGEFLRGLVESNGSLDLDSASKSEIKFAPLNWQLLPKGEVGWSAKGYILLFGFENRPSAVRLWLIVGPGDEDARRRLLDLALRSKDMLKPAVSTLKRKWNTIAVRQVLSARDFVDAEMPDLQDKVRAFWERFVTCEMPAIVAHIAGEFERTP